MDQKSFQHKNSANAFCPKFTPSFYPCLTGKKWKPTTLIFNMKKFTRLALAAVISFIFWQCSTLYKPDATKVPAGVTYDQLVQGRQLYVDNCGKCHGLHKPSEYDAAGWNKVMDKMQPKANINNDQRSLVMAYLTNYPKQ
jgi:mono/diheme cytochrome c family protein